MKIEFFNLGTIKHTELDLRPLTIIIGPNNSNKTYIAYSIYGLWKFARQNRRVEAELKTSVRDHKIRLENVEALVESTNSKARLAARSFSSNLPIFFQDTSSNLFANTKYTIDVSEDEIRRAYNEMSGLELRSLSGRGYYRLSVEDNVLSMIPTFQNIDSLVTALDSGFMMGEISNVLMRVAFPEPFVLPAERNALVITYRMLANRRYKMLREGQRLLIGGQREAQRQAELLREQGDIRYPEPIEDFLDALTDIEIGDETSIEENSRYAETASRNGRAKNSFNEVTALIEQHIQSGHKTEFRATRLGGKEIVIKVNRDLKIDLYNASSSIKQLAPLLLYLRYRARKNDLLIIDEPEMNLHPESQVKLLEILAILVNSGVNVLLTTHSPYFLAHLNNLAQSEDKPAAVRKRQATSLYLKDPRAFLSMEQVSAYEMKENELETLKDPDYGIRWDTLSDVSVDVQQKYFEIYEKGKVSQRARANRSAQTAQGEKG